LVWNLLYQHSKTEEKSMQYTKPMIDLVYEIRRRVDADMKPSVKMANPEMLKELADYHQQTKDTITKTLIKELLFMAGEQWRQLLEPVSPEAAQVPDITKQKVPEIPRQVVKVYRGQTILVDAPRATHANPVRMYRGHPVV
jgi:uncharacterized protein YicC (UPF0701 family)